MLRTDLQGAEWLDESRAKEMAVQLTELADHVTTDRS
jgi:hypothetical protein